MTDDKNPEEEKPSFFDFSEEESSSWPPSGAQSPKEPEAAAEETGSDDDFNIEDLFSDDLEDDTQLEEQVLNTPEPVEIDLIPLEPKTEENEDEEIQEEANEELRSFESITKQHEPEPDLVPAEAELEEENEIIFEEVPTTEAVYESFSEETSPENEESVDALFTDYSEPSNMEQDLPAYQPPEIAEDQEEEMLAFRTFTTYDYVDEAITDAEAVDEDEKPGINRNILILLAVFLIVGGWYGYKTIFVKEYKAKGRRERRAPSKKPQALSTLEKELIPVWELSSQKFTSQASENDLVTTVYENSGRDNPFLLPNSVIADMMKAAELELIKKQKPNTYRRKAYRATLIGVLTSTENTLAVVDFQEAVFDVLEGTAKDKIIKLATKAMDKSKENTQEMLVGSYIGPWQIKDIEAPEDSFIEPRITIEHGKQHKVLNMGKAVELGIFDDDGNLDNLEEPVDEVSLEDFKW